MQAAPVQGRDKDYLLTLWDSGSIFYFLFFFPRNNKQGRKRLQGLGAEQAEGPKRRQAEQRGGDGKASPNPAACG